LGTAVTVQQGCQMVFAYQIILIFGKFWKASDGNFFGTFYGHLVFYCNLVSFWPFGILLTILVHWTMKNLATLLSSLEFLTPLDAMKGTLNRKK
jgi:hypothetical protein